MEVSLILIGTCLCPYICCLLIGPNVCQTGLNLSVFLTGYLKIHHSLFYTEKCLSVNVVGYPFCHFVAQYFVAEESLIHLKKNERKHYLLVIQNIFMCFTPPNIYHVHLQHSRISS